MKTTIIPNCNNSPQKQFLCDFNTAFAKGNIDFLSKSVTDNFHWNIVGENEVTGKNEFIDILKAMECEGDKITEALIETILVEENSAVINGRLETEGGKKYNFVDIAEFERAGGKIQKLISYVIAV